MKDSPWSKNVIILNLVAIICLMSLATYMILVKSWIFLLIYWVNWILFFTVGRYFSCRHCDFHGKACPSWCMGIIGGKLYKRSNKKNFCEDGGLLKAILFDITFLMLGIFFPYLIYMYYSLTDVLTLVDWVLLGIYSLLVVFTLGIHHKGCKKCPNDECLMSGTRKKK